MDPERRARILAEEMERRAGEPRILIINGVEVREFKRSKTWNVATPGKLRVGRENQARKIQPPVNLDLKCRNRLRPLHPPDVKSIVVPCIRLPNAAAVREYIKSATASSSGSKPEVKAAETNTGYVKTAETNTDAAGTKPEVKAAETNTGYVKTAETNTDAAGTKPEVKAAETNTGYVKTAETNTDAAGTKPEVKAAETNTGESNETNAAATAAATTDV